MSSKSTTVVLTGVGVITPGVNRISDLVSYCSEIKSPSLKQVDTIPPPQGMNNRELRRMAHLTRLALYAADEAIRDAGLTGQNGGLYVGLTHGTTSLLKEFHDFLFDFGPGMVSPNAFSNGVTNAPLGAVSKLLGLTRGGCTLVGYEHCGMEILHLAANAIGCNTVDFCCAGAAEEFSPILEETYGKLNWYSGQSLPESLPHPVSDISENKAIPLSEGSVFFSVCSMKFALKTAGNHGCFFTPVNDIQNFDQDVDIIISGAGSGPQDACELETLSCLLSFQKSPTGLLFSKSFFGETFAVSPLLSSAIAWDILVNEQTYPAYPANEILTDQVQKVVDFASINSILVIAGSRDGEVSAGLLTKSI